MLKRVVVYDTGQPLFQGNRLLSYLGGDVRVRGKPGIGLKVFQG